MRRVAALGLALLLAGCSPQQPTATSSSEVASTASATFVASTTSSMVDDVQGESSESSDSHPVPVPFTGRWIESGPYLDPLIVQQRSLIWDGEFFYQMLRVGFGDVRVWRSSDAIAWEELPQLGTASTVDGPRALVAHNGRLFAVGDVDGSVVMWEFNGESPWPSVGVGIEGVVDSLIFHDGAFVISGSVAAPGWEEYGRVNGRPILLRGAIWRSVDLVEWTEVVGDELIPTRTSVGRLFIAGDQLRASVWQSFPEAPIEGLPFQIVSSDGITWSVAENSQPRTFTLVEDPEGAFEWVSAPSGSPFPRPEAAGVAAPRAEWKGVPLASGSVIRVAESEEREEYPALWSQASTDTWVEVGPFSGVLDEPGVIGAIAPGGDRIATFAYLYERGREGTGVVLTFVLEFPVEQVMYDWINQTGLGQVDVDVWTERLDRACSQGVWEDEVARELAAEFIEQDQPYSMRDDGTPPDLDEAAATLWIMAVNYCRADFPTGEIQDGPIGR